MTHKPHLTVRQFQTLQCIFEGMVNKDIAKTLGVEVRTVKAHKHSLFKKFNISPRYVETVRLIHVLCHPEGAK